MRTDISSVPLMFKSRLIGILTVYKQFGKERLRAVVEEIAAELVQGLIASIVQSAQTDDMTLVVVKGTTHRPMTRTLF